MPKTFLFLISITIILLTAYLTIAFNSDSTKIPKSEIETAINQAKHLYRQGRMEGKDFSNGPCLSDALLPNWVVDIAHNPRLPIDDLPQNQCSAYREGKAQHFVELDPEGNLIRAK